MAGTARVQEIEAQSRMDVLIGQKKGDLQVATAEGAAMAKANGRAEALARERRSEPLFRRLSVEVSHTPQHALLLPRRAHNPRRRIHTAPAVMQP